MTKVSVFGQETEKEKGKPIELMEIITSTKSFFPDNQKWDNLQLFEKGYFGYSGDLILAWDNDGQKGVYLGHWNDGFVE